MTEHTKAPWVWIRKTGIIESADGKRAIAAVNNHWDGPLIAAAPDLLAALEKAADTFADFHKTLGLLQRPVPAEAARIAEEATRAAIAKALAT